MHFGDLIISFIQSTVSTHILPNQPSGLKFKFVKHSSGSVEGVTNLLLHYSGSLAKGTFFQCQRITESGSESLFFIEVLRRIVKLKLMSR